MKSENEKHMILYLASDPRGFKTSRPLSTQKQLRMKNPDAETRTANLDASILVRKSEIIFDGGKIYTDFESESLMNLFLQKLLGFCKEKEMVNQKQEKKVAVNVLVREN